MVVGVFQTLIAKSNDVKIINKPMSIMLVLVLVPKLATCLHRMNHKIRAHPSVGNVAQQIAGNYTSDSKIKWVVLNSVKRIFDCCWYSAIDN